MCNKTILGGNWVYFKVYTGYRFAEKCLLRDVFPFVNENKHECDKWFFIRYNDDKGFHLRIRLHILSKDFMHSVIDWVHDSFEKQTKNQIITNIEYGTYEKEFGRYGYENYEQIESLFYFDSKCVCKILNSLRVNGMEDERWFCGLITIQSYLEIFIPDISSRVKFLNTMRDAYQNEFYMTDMDSVRILDRKYREYRSIIEKTLSSLKSVCTSDIMRVRHNEINEMVAFKDVKQKMSDNLSDFIHMSFNRLFENENRKYEFILYDFVLRYYLSILAKMKYKGETININLF